MIKNGLYMYISVNGMMCNHKKKSSKKEMKFTCRVLSAAIQSAEVLSAGYITIRTVLWCWYMVLGTHPPASLAIDEFREWQAEDTSRSASNLRRRRELEAYNKYY